MAINMPNSPTVGEIELADNGINYQWDGTKWIVYVDPTTLGNNVWTRESITAEVAPVNEGDSVIVRNSGGTTTITLDENGTISALEYDIDSLPSLP